MPRQQYSALQRHQLNQQGVDAESEEAEQEFVRMITEKEVTTTHVLCRVATHKADVGRSEPRAGKSQFAGALHARSGGTVPFECGAVPPSAAARRRHLSADQVHVRVR